MKLENLFTIKCPKCGSDIIIQRPLESHTIICPYCQGTMLYKASSKELEIGLEYEKLNHEKWMIDEQNKHEKWMMDEQNKHEKQENDNDVKDFLLHVVIPLFFLLLLVLIIVIDSHL